MLAELHSHSVYSRQIKVVVEGLDRPDAMVRAAKSKGIEALAITDHDEIKGSLQALKLGKKYGISIIPGMEVTTSRGHLVALGIEELIPKGLSVEESLDLIHEQGGIGIASHPFDVKQEGMKHKAKICDAIEIFNALNIERISNWKAAIFAKKYRLPGVAVSDAHWTRMIGRSLTDIHSEPDIDQMLKAIRKNRVDLITNYHTTKLIMEWSVIRLQNSYPDVLDYINENYRWPKRVISRKALQLVKRSPGNIDYLFSLLAYFTLANIIAYKAVREALRIG